MHPDLTPGLTQGPLPTRTVAQGRRQRRILSLPGLLDLLLVALLGAGAAALLTQGHALSGPLMTPTQLKYHVFDKIGGPFFCDSDFWPVVTIGGEMDNALTTFPDLKKNPEEYQAILQRASLTGHVTSFTSEQKLLVYREHKKLNQGIHFQPAATTEADIYSFSLQVGGTWMEGRVYRNGYIMVTRREPQMAPCSVCLAGDSLIDTPAGPLKVRDMRVGMPIWTASRAGVTLPATVVQITMRPVPKEHEMVHLMLAGGRELYVSPGHPLTNGLPVGTLVVGDIVDGSEVKGVSRTTYTEGYTYDILPSGETSWYRANGILIGSTLASTHAASFSLPTLLAALRLSLVISP